VTIVIDTFAMIAIGVTTFKQIMKSEFVIDVMLFIVEVAMKWIYAKIVMK